MLDLQRASAGSGKTHSLAKKFIWYYITVVDENSSSGKRRLRHIEEIADSISHILAITFTNKATNEMQMRIVERLFKLAYPDGSDDDYMTDFSKALGETPEKISRVSRYALHVLLSNYSDFNVSTIDSFFQRVLRTFTYEADISDSYQVELNGNYLSHVGVDDTLDEVDTNPSCEAATWIQDIMTSTNSGWNIFLKKDNTASYKSLLKNVDRLNNEEYKKIRPLLEAYFAAHPYFHKIYEDLKKECENDVRKAWNNMCGHARDLKGILPDNMKGLNGNNFLSLPEKGLKACLDTNWDTAPKKVVPSFDEMQAKVSKKLDDEDLFNKISAAYKLLYDAYLHWTDLRETNRFRHWKVYKGNMPFMGLLEILDRKRRDYLIDNNAIELSETSVLLRSIIGDETDAPFIYERLGTRLNHFLIDEFQDTSLLQWENLQPLLNESMSHDHDNLIIGDVKQSIYRFRNARPELISNVVPDYYKLSYPDSVRILGDKPSENTNWRSRLGIVQFNNAFFRWFSRELSSDIASLYNGVVQTPHFREPEGYVEVRFYRTTSSKEEKAVSRPEKTVELIVDLMRRGFAFEDIAVLVDTNQHGTDIINAILAHNREARENGEREIEFVSEQSLIISSAVSVRVIEAVLRSVANGANATIQPEESRKKKGVGKWTDIECAFRFFDISKGNPENSIAERLDSFIKSGGDVTRLRDMLAKMPAMTLPAIVEAAVAEFIDPETRRREAGFIAAFQDLVLEYCDSHPTDVASFLRWWDLLRDKASIASPEDVKAIKIMTVHKSKGLEFACVIVPFEDAEISDHVPPEHRREWTWVKPAPVFNPSLDLPPYLPVELTADLEGTAHENSLHEYYDLLRKDDLNKSYVAYTRATDELYIFTVPPTKPDKNGQIKKQTMGDYLNRFMTGYDKLGLNAEFDPMFVPAVGSVRETEEGYLAIGERCEDFDSLKKMRKAAKEAKEEQRKAESEKSGYVFKKERSKKESMAAGAYYSGVPAAKLKFRLSDLTSWAPEEKDDAEDAETAGSGLFPGEESPLEILDKNPRSEGNLKHAILQNVATASDLDMAIRIVQASGLLLDDEAREYRAQLSRAIGEVEARHWFDGTAQIINERPILNGSGHLPRPDRVMLFPDGSAVVVDYKFGKVPENLNRYNNQVFGYVNALRKSGRFKNVKGYLWFVNESRVFNVSGFVKDKQKP